MPRQEKEQQDAGLIFNLLMLYQAVLSRGRGNRKSSTLRRSVFTGAAILEQAGRDTVQSFLESLGVLKKGIPWRFGQMLR